MITVGVGNTGMKLARMFDEDSILISTAHQDSENFKDYEVHTFTEEGCGKKFGTGVKLWKGITNQLEDLLDGIENEKVVIFSSLGGGSGSSSLQFLSKILLAKENKVFIVGVLPYKKEVVPPLANAVQSINSLMPFINDVTVMLFDNQTLLKEYENSWKDVNESIIMKVNYVVNLLKKHSVDGYSPLTIDQSELESVVFGGGFIDVSDDFLEETTPKFHYGKMDAQTKNVLIAMFVDQYVSDRKMEEYHNTLTSVQMKYSGRVKNARMVTGIVRGRVLGSKSNLNFKDRAYVTIASGLNVEKYSIKIEKLRDEAIEKATIFSSKIVGAKVVSSKDSKLLDI